MPSIPPRVGKAASAYRVSRSAAPRGNRLICIERPRLFDGLSLSECTEVVSCAQLKCLRPKENISGHDYAVHPISLLLRGRVKTVRLNRFGVQVVLRIEEAGDLVGELVPAFGPLDRLRVQALEACQILGWADETFGTLCERFARLGRNSVQILDERLRILEERFLELATESADSRLARMLIRLLGEKRSPAGQLVKISFSNLELAQMTGMSQFTVNRLLSGWQQCEIIQRQRKAVYLLDLTALTRIAGTRTSDGSPTRANGAGSSSTVTSQPVA